ncbi:hypothetical protein [Burkholderia multivorans]|uniref:hypothetical protein n=1 Tax=Burkholderia multivorans TaxID=87883 RepID=UPI00345EA166
MSSNSYVNLKIATCLVRYADDRLIDQRFPYATVQLNGYVQVNKHLRASVVLNNLFNRTYYVSSYNSLWVTPGAPRSLFASLSYTF